MPATPAGDALPPGLPDALEFNPGGLAVLWAEENSRDALFAAMQRREAYGTSGTRAARALLRRLRASPADLCERADFVARGLRGGRPDGRRARGCAGRRRRLRFAV